MSYNTKIEWTDHTWNPWIGCTKVSPGCSNCYAEVSTPARTKQIEWGKGQERQRTSAAYWKDPLRWNKNAQAARLNHESESPLHDEGDLEPYVRPRVFPSLCDWLDEDVPIEWLADFLSLIQRTPELDWLLLTKRIESAIPRLQQLKRLGVREDGLSAAQRANPDNPDIDINENYGHCIALDWLAGTSPNNLWLGVSAENQKYWDDRVAVLKMIPATVRFVSAEPLLSGIDCRFPAGASTNIEFPDGYEGWSEKRKAEFITGMARATLITRKSIGIDWVIVGGESGSKARPCNVEWIESIVAQCRGADVPCFVKQLGANPRETPSPEDDEYADTGMLVPMYRIKHPKGGDPAEWPERLRVREFPGRKKVA